MLHCLVFKEQLFVFRSLPSFEMLCFKRLIYCTASLLDCQELFYFSFLSERRPSCMTCKCFHSRNVVSHFVLAGISRRLVLYYRSCAHLSTAILNFFRDFSTAQGAVPEYEKSIACAMLISIWQG